MNISVATYTVSVRERRTSTPDSISNFNGSDLRVILYEFIQSISHTPSDLESDQSLLQSIQFQRDGDYIRGFVETGKYGYQARGIDRRTDQPSYTRTVNDAEMLPFYFMFYLPEGENFGLMLIQRFGTHGVYTPFTKQINNFFSNREPHYSIRFESAVLPSLIDDFNRNSVAKKLKFRTYTIPSDVADQYDNTVNSDNAYVEYSIVAKKNCNLRNLMNAVRQNPAMLSLPNFEPEEISMQVTLNGKTRTVDINNPNDIRSYYEITNDVEIDDRTGHPTEESLRRVFYGLCDDLWMSLVSSN